MNYYKDAFRKFTDFNTRTSRTGYWYFVLFNFIVGAVLGFASGFIGFIAKSSLFAGIPTLYSLVILIPSIAISVRRLHDTNRSGWWILINFIPFIGLLVFLYFTLQRGDDGDNQYGVNPRSGEETTVITDTPVQEQVPAPVQQ
jgi:uncharacterized membrane protein YhaH (DUF805 family)